MPGRMTLADFISAARNAHGDRYGYSRTEYKNAKTKVVIICPEHGAFEQTPETHLRGHGCPMCGSPADDRDSFILKAIAVHGDRYDYAQVDYRGSAEKVTVVCPEHGAFQIRPSSHLGGKQGCKQCGLRRRSERATKTTEQFVAEAKAVHGDRYDYSRVEYTSALAGVTIICREHGAFTQRAVSHLRGSGCPHCAGVAKKDMAWFVAQATAVHGDKYQYPAEYAGCSAPLRVTCPRHGDFYPTPINHIHGGSGCPKCAAGAGASAIENDLCARLTSAGLRVEQHNTTVLGGREIDLVVNGRVGVEVCGRYWHSEAHGKSREYHLSKTNGAAHAGVNLLTLWADEVERDPDLVVSMVQAKLGLGERVFARRCIVRDVSAAECRGFLTANHMQGDAAARVRLGLYHADRLVAVMTFGKPRFNKGFDWELIRFCSLAGVRVLGGAGKLLAHFRARYPGSVVSYANRRWSDGGLYTALGFSLVGTSAPGYDWVHGRKVLSRHQCQKHKLSALLGSGFDPGKSEAENMRAAGFSRVWDCGNLVFAID